MGDADLMVTCTFSTTLASHATRQRWPLFYSSGSLSNTLPIFSQKVTAKAGVNDDLEWCLSSTLAQTGKTDLLSPICDGGIARNQKH